MNVILHNSCTGEVQVYAFPDAIPFNDESEDRTLNKLLQPNDDLRVLSMNVFTNDTDDFPEIVPNNYRLRISANGREINMDRSKFLQEVQKAAYKHHGDFHIWTINNPSLCP